MTRPDESPCKPPVELSSPPAEFDCSPKLFLRRPAVSALNRHSLSASPASPRAGSLPPRPSPESLARWFPSKPQLGRRHLPRSAVHATRPPPPARLGRLLVVPTPASSGSLLGSPPPRPGAPRQAATRNHWDGLVCSRGPPGFISSTRRLRRHPDAPLNRLHHWPVWPPHRPGSRSRFIRSSPNRLAGSRTKAVVRFYHSRGLVLYSVVYRPVLNQALTRRAFRNHPADSLLAQFPSNHRR